MPKRDKAEKFVELANKRVNKALKHLKLVGNLSNRNNYEYSEQQVRKIVKALQEEIDGIRQRFQDADARKDNDFVL